MEFSEKLQELRKNKGLTQEELAHALFVSRTAISKWESGRGYPNIDSLKEISVFFSVAIDDLLSSEKIIHIAERENKTNIQNICNLLFGIADFLNILLIILPLYPKTINDYVYSVNLFSPSDTAPAYLQVYWALFILLAAFGIVKIVLSHLKKAKWQKPLTFVSFAVNICAVLILALTRCAYATVISFLLLTIKSILFFKTK